MNKELEALDKLIKVIERLRIECPWDRKQTLESLRTLSIEETFELATAIIKKDTKEICTELGDLLLHIIFYSKIADDQNLFTLENVCNSLTDKLIYRHPHIFGAVQVKNSNEVESNWEILKLKEGKNKTILGGVPETLPSFIKAYRIQDKARSAGFDWKQKEDVWEKVREEINELETEIKNLDQEKIEAEFGDLFFSLINTARLYKVNPDNALEKTNQKFTKRFNYIEQKAKEQGRYVKEMSLEEMDFYWNEAKTKD